jgi:hypothetical protein
MGCGGTGAGTNLPGVTDLSAVGTPAAETSQDNIRWHKSSRSTFNSNCVEVGVISEGNSVLVRDTKNPGPVLKFAADAWSNFIRQIKETHS